jgi:O-antigen/teichoic acid export membrane protein
MKALREALSGNGIGARAVRGAGWATFGFVASQAIRLAFNLILTRLLFPEAFGLMALVQVFLVGLTMFSDVGLGPSIMQNKRGDEPDFLNTAWTIQVIRGALLWIGTCALALPVANFYNEPMLAQLLPVAGFVLFIGGFNPTRIETANRHLSIKPVMLIDIGSQVIGAVAMVAWALATKSVWSLVVGGIVSAVARLVLAQWLLPGPFNRFRWEGPAVRELVHFGKWIFFSTAVGFIILQGDKAILGKYLSLEQLGIYNIGHFLATAPLYLAGAIINRVFIPLYRDNPPAESAQNFRKVRWMRFALTGALLAMTLVIAFGGVLLVGVLYDPRYILAGGIVVAIACVQSIQLVGMTYDQAALAAGDSRNFFILYATRGLLQIPFFIVGVETAGLAGALAGQGLALLLLHPMVVWLARRHGVWDPWHDLVYMVTALALATLAIWYNWSAVMGLAAFGAS